MSFGWGGVGGEEVGGGEDKELFDGVERNESDLGQLI